MVPGPERGADAVRRLRAIEQLLALEATEPRPAMQQAAQTLAEVLGADKVDVFLRDAEGRALVAIGTSDTPMGREQHRLGLDRLSLADGGRAAEVFRSGESCLSRRSDADPRELRAIVEELGVRSGIFAPLAVGGERRGVLMASSAEPDYFDEEDLRFLEAASRWVGLLMHRAELVEQLVGQAEERGRHEILEKLLGQLTPRQTEVAVLIALGRTNEQIAERLVLVPGTVANHVEAILSRLGFQSRTQVATLIAELGLHRTHPITQQIDQTATERPSGRGRFRATAGRARPAELGARRAALRPRSGSRD